MDDYRRHHGHHAHVITHHHPAGKFSQMVHSGNFWVVVFVVAFFAAFIFLMIWALATGQFKGGYGPYFPYY